MAVTLSAATRALVDGRNYCVLATLSADGSPQTSVVWVTRDGDDVRAWDAEDGLDIGNVTAMHHGNGRSWVAGQFGVALLGGGVRHCANVEANFGGRSIQTHSATRSTLNNYAKPRFFTTAVVECALLSV